MDVNALVDVIDQAQDQQLSPESSEILNMEVVYCNLFSLLNSRGVSLSNLNFEHKEVLYFCKDLDGCWIAGGAPLALYRGKHDQIKDWDLFFNSDESRKEAMSGLLDIGFEQCNESKWSTSYKKNDIMVQTVRFKNFRDIDHVFKNFDISICCFAIEENNIIFTKQAQQDVENMVFNFAKTKNPAYSLSRIIKYSMKGFKLTNHSMIKFLLNVKKCSDDEIKNKDFKFGES